MVLAGLVLVLSPAAAFAAITGNISSCGGGGLSPLEQFICKIGDILNIIIPILIVLAIVYFIWGVIQYVISDDEEAKQAGRNRIIFGIIGLAVIVGVWGLVAILTQTFGVEGQQNITFPTTPY
ncbi:MAG: hypothetical protein UY01_C0007G0024 [Candidatus Nomurabacteria bacterium GW2011_GWB1_47_6]|uniref:DUF4190 domain-containing protein n=1 Tax=Candidatus Nomurabacteria bacterium GW2011_GWB1_47_6 TaxID=1618749 RepID=A0A0G1T1G9_9BACT|nr:MAG: hypothetical protein UY01_C0007G0024 [Candidatus Nomurabacteria bacterium GW2011_GWB1_47_6]